MTTVASSLAERSEPINPRRLAILAGLVVAAAVPLVGNDYWLNSLIIPTIVMGLAGLGLNLAVRLGSASGTSASRMVVQFPPPIALTASMRPRSTSRSAASETRPK